MKKYLLPLAAFLIPVFVYFLIILGWSAGEDCVAGINGIAPSGISDYFYCQQQIDTGAYSWQHIPQWHLVANDWLKGILPLWNPHQGVGVPLAANFISGAFNPMLVIFNLFGSILVTRWYLVFRVAFASLGMYLFLNKFTKTKWASLAGALFFVFSGYFTQYFSMNHHDIDFCLPWLILFALHARDKKIFWGINSFLVALSILAGMPESTFLVLGFYSIFCLYLAFCDKGEERLRIIKLFLLSTILGVAMSAILLLPGFEYVKNAESSRVIGLVNIYSVEAKNIIYWLFPRLAGPYYNILSRSTVLGVQNINYFGVLGSILVIAGLFTDGFVFIKIFFLVLVAQYFGLLQLPLNWIPILKDTIYIKYALGIINFLASILLVKGIVLWQKDIKKRQLIFRLFFIIVLLGIIFFAKDLLATLGNVPLWKAKATLAFIVLQSVFALILIIFLFKIKKEKYLAILIILEMVAYTPIFGARFRTTSIQAPEFVNWLMKNNDGSRIFSTDGYLYPDYASYFGLNDIRDLDALWPKNYYEYLKKYIQPDLDMAWLRFSSIKDTPLQREAKILNNDYFDLLGVKYIISGTVINSPQLELEYDKEVKIYLNKNAVDRLRFVSTVLCNSKPGEKISIKDAAEVDGTNCTDKSYPKGLISKVSFGENSITAAYSATESGFLVLTDTYYPGWRATIAGKQLSIVEVDGVFRGVEVPKGDNIIRFEYKPNSFDLGLKISIAGLAGTILLLFYGAKKSKDD